MAVQRKRQGDAGLNEYALNTNRSVEYLEELQGRTGSLNYRRMSKGDPVIGMILRTHKNPLRSAAWDIPYPSDATDKEKLAIDIIKSVLFGESGTEFDVFLSKALSCLEYGFSLFEQYYEPKKFDGNLYLVPVLEQRMQTSIEDIFPKRKVVRQLTIDSGVVEIPFDNLVFFVLNQLGDDLRGESILRNAYKTYKDKKVYQEWLGIGIQRSVSGVPSMKVPKGTSSDSPDYIAAELLLKGITQHENAYMILEEGFDFDIHESKFNADPVQKAIDSCNAEMSLSVLVQFMLLGQQGNTGAFALSRDQSDFFLDGLSYIINIISGVVNNRIIRPFIKINFGDEIAPERVVIYATNLNKKAGIELSDVLQKLSASGFIKPTVNDEIQLRSGLELPELTEDEIEKRKVDHIEKPETIKINNDDDPIKEPVKLSEPKIKYAKDRREYIDNSEKEMSDYMKASLLLIKDKMLADIESVLKKGTVEINGLKTVTVSSSKYIKGLNMKLAGIAQESYERAQKSAKSNKIKFSDINPKDVTDKALKAFVLNQAQSISDKQVAALLNRAILTASNSILKGLTVSQAISNTSKSADEYIDSPAVAVDGSLIVVGTANFGEMQFYKEIEDQIWGYRFEAIDDDRTSEICSWYSGKTFSVNSPELAEAIPPKHPQCRSYMDPIYKSEIKPDEIDDVIPPPTIRKQGWNL